MARISDGMQPTIGPSAWGTEGKAVVAGKGQTMEHIATQQNVSLGDLMKANPHIKDPGQIQAGQEIRIPDKAKGPGMQMGQGLGGGVEFERSSRNIFDDLPKGLPVAGGVKTGEGGELQRDGLGDDLGEALEEEKGDAIEGAKEDATAALKGALPQSALDAAASAQSVLDGATFATGELQTKTDELKAAKSTNSKDEIKPKADALKQAVEGRVIQINNRLTEMEKGGLTDAEKAEAAALYTELVALQGVLITNLSDPPEAKQTLDKALSPKSQNGVVKCMDRIEGMVGQEILSSF